MFDFNLERALLMMPAILFGFSIHEFSHAIAAVKLGDRTPEEQGRLTLNPLVHLDLIGFVLFFIAGFGWAKPVQTNPNAYKNPRRDDILVSVAGPLSNLVGAVFFAILFKVIIQFYQGLLTNPTYGNQLKTMLIYFIWVNIILAIFNLIPIPPLDGSHILFDILPYRFQSFKERFFQFGSIILIGIILIENNTKMDILPIGKAGMAIFNGLFGILGIN